MISPQTLPAPAADPPSRGARSVGLSYGMLALSMALVGSYVALSKPLTWVFPVFVLAWMRFGIGALAMLHWLRKPQEEPPLSMRTHGLLFAASLFGNFLFSICMLYGMRLTSAVSAGVILAATPAVVALLGWLFLKEPIQLRLVLAVMLAGLGAGLCTLAGQPGGLESAGHDALAGNLLMMAAVLCEALYAVIGKRLTAELSARRISALINLWGLVLMTPLGLALAWQFDFAAFAWQHWALLLFYGWAASVWTVWLWMTGLQGVPASHSGIFTVFMPIAATAVGTLLLGESPQPLQVLALVLTLLGVLLASSTSRR